MVKNALAAMAPPRTRREELPQSPNWNNGVRREREKEGSGGRARNGEERGGWEERGRENVKGGVEIIDLKTVKTVSRQFFLLGLRLGFEFDSVSH